MKKQTRTRWSSHKNDYKLNHITNCDKGCYCPLSLRLSGRREEKTITSVSFPLHWVHWWLKGLKYMYNESDSFSTSGLSYASGRLRKRQTMLPNFQRPFLYIHFLNGRLMRSVSCACKFSLRSVVTKRQWWRCNSPCNNTNMFGNKEARALRAATGRCGSDAGHKHKEWRDLDLSSEHIQASFLLHSGLLCFSAPVPHLFSEDIQEKYVELQMQIIYY